MRIGIDISRANDPKRTGVGWYVFFLLEAMKSLPLPPDTEIFLYTKDALLPELAAVPSGFYHRQLSWPPQILWSQVRLGLASLTDRLDVLFVPGHVVPMLHPRHAVNVIHDIGPFRFPHAYSAFQKWYGLWSARFVLRRTDPVIVPSEFTHTEIGEFMGDRIRAPITVIPLAYDLRYADASFDAHIDAVKKIYKLPDSYILSVGRKEEKKNTGRLIDAFFSLADEYPDTDLLLVGTDGYGSEKELAALRNHPLAHRVHNIAYMPQEDLIACMRAARVFALVSVYEGFGIPALEAAAAGVPRVLSRAGSLPEVGGDGPEYVDPLDTKSIASGLRAMLPDEHARTRSIERGREHIKTYSWEMTARKTFDTLQRAYES